MTLRSPNDPFFLPEEKLVLPPEPKGVWVVVALNHYTYIERAFETELEALRFVNAQGYYSEVRFLEYGKSLTD